MAMNNSKVVVAGLAAGVVANIIGFLGFGVLLGPRFEAEAAAVAPALQGRGMTGGAITTNIVATFVVGILLVWLYAAIRPRFGPGMKTATYAAAAVWIASCACAIVLTAQSPSDIVTEFKYGSIGTEGTVGVPYWIFKVLPEVFPDKLPNRAGNGYERIGFTYESPSSDLPIGTTRSNDWVPRVGLNCATCHAGQYRESPGAPPKRPRRRLPPRPSSWPSNSRPAPVRPRRRAGWNPRPQRRSSSSSSRPRP